MKKSWKKFSSSLKRITFQSKHFLDRRSWRVSNLDVTFLSDSFSFIIIFSSCITCLFFLKKAQAIILVAMVVNEAK